MSAAPGTPRARAPRALRGSRGRCDRRRARPSVMQVAERRRSRARGSTPGRTPPSTGAGRRSGRRSDRGRSGEAARSACSARRIARRVRRAVAQPRPPVLVLAQPPLLVAEEHEPADRHVPRALVAERHRVRVAPAEPREVLRGALRRPSSARTDPTAPSAAPRGTTSIAASTRIRIRHGLDVGAPVDHADLGVLAVGRRQHPEPAHGVGGRRTGDGGTALRGRRAGSAPSAAAHRARTRRAAGTRGGRRWAPRRRSLASVGHPLCSRRSTRGA